MAKLSLASISLALLAVAACDRHDTAAATSASPSPAAAPSAAASRVVVLDSPEALWEGFKAAHQGATKENALVTGRLLDAMLSNDARRLVSASVSAIAQRLPARLMPASDDARYQMEGEGAAVRSAQIRGMTLRTVTRHETSGATLELAGADGKKALVLEAVREGGLWRLAMTPDLLVKEEDLFPTPPKPADAGAAGAASVQDIARRWCDVLNGGDGWAAYRLFDKASKKRVLQLVASVGGSGENDAVRILEKTVRDRQARGLHATVALAVADSADRGRMEISYSNGTSDKFSAVREDGAWWLVAPF